ncbi:MAG: ABC transporter substrate-binding protein [Bacilli bacterium]|jgi:oligopeptide transport system substrate-binding protein
MKKIPKLAVFSLAVVSMVVGCDGNNEGVGRYTYSTFDVASPNTWNPHEWETNTDSIIIGYTEMGLYDFVLNEEKDGYDIIPEMADGQPVDVSNTLTDAERARYGVGDGEEGLKWQINLNQNAKWSDGEVINADDYIYSMQQMLNPLMLNRRADSFYAGTLTLGNARDYRYGGLKKYENLAEPGDSIDSKTYFSMFEPTAFDALTGYSMVVDYTDYAEYFPLGAAAFASGVYGTASLPLMVEVTDANAAAIQAIVYEYLSAGYGVEEADLAAYAEYIYFKCVGVNDEVAFDGTEKAVGLVKSGDFQVTLLLAAPITDFFLKYNLSSNWLVKESLYEAGKSPVSGITKTNYGTALNNYMGFGPYKLTQYQLDKLYVLEKNDNWYGYSDGKHVGQFQTDVIRFQIVPAHATALQMFEKGEIDDIGLVAADMDKYKNSSNLLFTPESYTRKVTFSTDWVSLKNRQEEETNINKTILTNIKFREAFSWALDREDFTQSLTSGSTPYLVPINNLYVSDPVTGVSYRNTEQGQSVVETVFGDNTNGYDLVKARQLLTEAYSEELANTAEGHLEASDSVKLTFWVYGEDDIYTNYANFLDAAIKAAAVGTPLEGKISVERQVDADYSDRMQSGGADMCFSTWGGATMDPFGIMQVYTDPTLKYEYGFDTENEELTINVGGVDVTLTWVDWNYELNDGNGTYSASKAELDTRLDILAAMELALVQKWVFASVYAYSNASMFSYKIKFATIEYVNLVAYGGIRFMTYNYDDAAWAKYIKDNTLDYTK